MSKEELIEALEEMIEEEEDGVEAYKELFEDINSAGDEYISAAKIIKEILNDEEEHIQKLIEAISYLEE